MTPYMNNKNHWIHLMHMIPKHATLDARSETKPCTLLGNLYHMLRMALSRACI